MQVYSDFYSSQYHVQVWQSTQTIILDHQPTREPHTNHSHQNVGSTLAIEANHLLITVACRGKLSLLCTGPICTLSLGGWVDDVHAITIPRLTCQCHV